jgi:dipeptidyl-peptidase-4
MATIHKEIEIERSAEFVWDAMRTPQENPEGYERSSLIPRANDLPGPFLIVYGTYDDNVHPYNELAFIDALVAAGKKFE